MNLEEAKFKITITPEEDEALRRYQGFKHTTINTLCNMSPEVYKSLNNSGWEMLKTKEDIEQAIEEFVKIYSAIYKYSYNRKYSGTLVRGTGNEDVNRMSGKITSFLSTTTSEEIAKTFTHYGDDAILRINIDEGVPYIDMSEYVNENSRDESEILISPFCEIYNKDLVSNWNGYKYYKMGIRKANLQEKEQSEIDSLKEITINGFEKDISDMKEYLKYAHRIELLKERYKRAQGDKEEQIEIKEQIKEETKKLEELKNRVYRFKLGLQDLLEGMCKQKELEIDRAYEIIQKDLEIKQEIRKKELEIEKAQEIRKNAFNDLNSNVENALVSSKRLVDKLDEFYNDLSKQNANFESVSEILQIKYYSGSNISNIKQKINSIKEVLESASSKINKERQDEEDQSVTVESANEKSKNIKVYRTDIGDAIKIFETLYELSDNFAIDTNMRNKRGCLYKSNINYKSC